MNKFEKIVKNTVKRCNDPKVRVSPLARFIHLDQEEIKADQGSGLQGLNFLGKAHTKRCKNIVVWKRYVMSTWKAYEIF